MDTINPYPLLKAVRERLSDRAAWTTNTYARNKNGRPVAVNAPTAVSWCVRGAMMREICAHPEYAWRMHGAAMNLLSNVAAVTLGTRATTYVNDTLGYDAVIKMLDTALFECRAE